MNVIKSLSIDEFLQRVGSQPNGNIWSVLVTQDANNQELVEELQESLGIFTECEVGVISASDNVNSVVDNIQESVEDYLIIWDLEDWLEGNWREFDQMRSRLLKKRGVVLILSSASVEKMFSDAPNLVSWIGSRVYGFIKNSELLSEEERQIRLSALREWSGLSDSRLIELAEAHNLPLEPEYGEWLVLLGREDLIGR